MGKNQLDMIIDEKLYTLREEKYKLRTFQVSLLIRIDADFGIEETSQDIRSLPGVTVVTALSSQFLETQREYNSVIRVKFHPQKDSVSGVHYVEKKLIPAINSSKIPGVRVIRQLTHAEDIK
jgi:hypothetical protein